MNNDVFNRHRGPVTCVAGIPGTNAAVSSAYDGAIAYVDLSQRTMELWVIMTTWPIASRSTASGTLAASASSDYTIYIWDLKKRQRRIGAQRPLG